MPFPEASPSLAMVAAFVPLLALTGCAALTQDVVIRDGKPCNALCQRWMGVTQPGQEVVTPTPSVRPARRPKPISLRRRAPAVELDNGDHPSQRRPVATARAAPVVEPAPAAPIPSQPPLGRWGAQIPGSAPAPSDAEFVVP